ncbi:MAG: hypothetical protein P8H97_07555 [Pseudomonadales bacterium]|nr:hypothetical protein [Pseudomonadales bacterium]MDG2079409.1 hypothetical protein [Pseudomonadales bacterium]
MNNASDTDWLTARTSMDLGPRLPAFEPVTGADKRPEHSIELPNGFRLLLV